MSDDAVDPSAPAGTIWRDGEPVYDRGEAVCVIGAGASGLTTIKNLREHGFQVDCYERETSVGGAWNWRHDRSPVYASIHLISSRPFTQFPDFPMPDDWPDYPHHSQLLAYFERYADHFGLREHIWFGTDVVRAEPAPHGLGSTAPAPRWDVTVRGSREGTLRTMRYAAVVAANGHNWSPKMPRYEGMDTFRGQVIHAGAYKESSQLRGKRVLVVGAGNTGCDIAVEAAQQAAKCWHSSRRGYWYAPKYSLGRPTDQINDRLLGMRVPLAMRQWIGHRAIRLTVGDVTRFGLARPDHKIYETHPIVNSQLVYYVGHGGIIPVPDITKFDGSSITFADGRTADPDLVVLATGYLPRFEFLAPDLLGAPPDGPPRLRWQLFSPTHPTLAVVGLVQPDSAIFPIAHWQAVLVARWLRAVEASPERASDWWKRQADGAERRFVEAKVKDSTRHWFEISHWTYLRAVERALTGLEAVR